MDSLVVLPCSCICLNSSRTVKLVDVNTLLFAGHESSDCTGSFVFPSFGSFSHAVIGQAV